MPYRKIRGELSQDCVLAGPHVPTISKTLFQIYPFISLLVEIMAECADSRCLELEKKLVRLNVTLNDKSESIDVLIKAIDDIEIQVIKESGEIDSKFQQEYEEKSKFQIDELNSLEKQCSGFVENKERITSETEKVMSRQKEAESRLSAALDEVRTRTEESLAKSLQEWKEGQTKREQEFMADKVMKVRKATLAALQPELQRLLDRQRIEIDQLEQEEETKLKYSSYEVKSNYETRISEYRKDSENQKTFLVARRKDEWREQIASIQDAYAVKLDDMHHEREDWKTQLAVKELEKEKALIERKYERCIDKIMESRNLKLREIENKFAEHEMELDNESKIARKKVESDDSDVKNTWKQEQKDELKIKLDNCLADFRKTIEEERDETIDKEIRIAQKNESHFEREFVNRVARDNDCVEQEFEEKTQCVKGESTVNQQQVRIIFAAIEELQKSVQAQTDQLEITERNVEKANHEVNNLKQQHDDAENDMKNKDVLTKAQANRSKFAAELSAAQDTLEDLNRKLCTFESYSTSTKNKLLIDHDMRLKQMEVNVKNEINALGKKAKEVEDEIDVERERVVKLQDLITKYILQDKSSTPPPKSRDVRKPRRSNRSASRQTK